MLLVKPRWRREVVVTGVGVSLTDYAVAIPLDIRDRVAVKFPAVYAVDESGSVLPAVVDKYMWTLGTPLVWVKIPSLPAGAAKTIYLYYGAARPVHLFRYSDVFIYGDDFQDPSFTDAYWSKSVYGDPSVTLSFIGSALRMSGSFPNTAVYQLYKPGVSYSPGKHHQYVVRSSYTGTGNIHAPRMDVGGDSAGRAVFIFYLQNAWRVATWSSAEGEVARYTVTGYPREWVVVDVYVTASGYRFLVRSLERAVTVMNYTFSTTPTSALPRFGIRNYSGSTQTLDAVFYHVLFRHYVSPEPSVSVGAEEEVYRYPDTV